MQWYFAAPSPISLSFPLPGKYPTEYLCIEKVKTFFVKANAFSTPSPNRIKESLYLNSEWNGGSPDSDCILKVYINIELTMVHI